MIKLILSLLTFIAFAATGFAAGDCQKIATKLVPPFKVLNLNNSWKLIESEKNLISCEQQDNEDIALVIVIGKQLKRKFTIKTLQKQLELFSNNTLKTVPLLAESFNFDEDDEEENDLFQIDGNITHFHLKGLEWLSFEYNSTIEITTIINDEAPVITFMPVHGKFYISAIKNRLIVVDFSTPTELYDDYKLVFEEGFPILY